MVRRTEGPDDVQEAEIAVDLYPRLRQRPVVTSISGRGGSSGSPRIAGDRDDLARKDSARVEDVREGAAGGAGTGGTGKREGRSDGAPSAPAPVQESRSDATA